MAKRTIRLRTELILPFGLMLLCAGVAVDQHHAAHSHANVSLLFWIATIGGTAVILFAVTIHRIWMRKRRESNP